MISKKEQTLNEFCKVGKLESFRDLLIQLFEIIEKSGCRISSRYEKLTSSHEFEIKGCCMRICLREIYSDPIEIIWTILHEFGHHISGKPALSIDSLLTKISREKIAWELGRPIAMQFPSLAIKIDSFDKYAEACIQTYIDGLKNGL